MFCIDGNMGESLSEMSIVLKIKRTMMLLVSRHDDKKMLMAIRVVRCV